MTTPTRAQVEALMKRCQIGVGGRNALSDAHSIMAECYGTLGALLLEVERLQGICVAAHDGLLGGEDDRALMDGLAQAWRPNAQTQRTDTAR